MRVLFLTLYPESAASARYRVHQFLPHLEARGVECVVHCAVSAQTYESHYGPNRQGRAAWYHLAETPRRVAQILRSRRYDVVFVQKALMSASVRGLAELLHSRARRIVYDIDDAVFLAPPHPLRAPWQRLEDSGQVRKVMNGADLILAGNHWLAHAAAEGLHRTTVWPTVVDTDRFAPNGSHDETYRIGWIGGPSTTPSIEIAGAALCRVQDAELCLVGADARTVSIHDAHVRPWRYETEVAEIRRFSIGIMPLPKTEWSRGKCALKALQYMACGVPCIATPFGAALDVIRHGENGLFADTTEEWIDAIGTLRDPQARARMGQAARASVEKHFALRDAAPKLHSLLESVA